MPVYDLQKIFADLEQSPEAIGQRFLNLAADVQKGRVAVKTMKIDFFRDHQAKVMLDLDCRNMLTEE